MFLIDRILLFFIALTLIGISSKSQLAFISLVYLVVIVFEFIIELDKFIRK